MGTGGAVHGTEGWQAAGIPYAERGSRTDAALRALPGLLAGRATTLVPEFASEPARPR